MLGLLLKEGGTVIILSCLCCGFYFLYRKVTDLCVRVRALEGQMARVLQKLEDWEREKTRFLPY